MSILEQIDKYLNEEKLLHWVCVRLDNKKKPWICVGVKGDKEADSLIDKLENYADYTVFAIDNYGKAPEDIIVKKYKPIDRIENARINPSFIKQLKKNLQ